MDYDLIRKYLFKIDRPFPERVFTLATFLQDIESRYPNKFS
jgi:hypothetical protein